MARTHQHKSAQKKSQPIPSPTPGRADLFGEPAKILAHGGQYNAERCNCSHRGLSCYHTFKTTLFHLYRIGWSLTDAQSYSTSLAFAWAQPTEEDPFKSTADAIESHWATLEASEHVIASRKLAWKRLRARKSHKKSTFRWIDEAARRLLTYVRFHTKLGKRALQRAMAKQHGWRKGTTDFYLRECVARGYLIYEKAIKPGLADSYQAHSSSAELYPRHPDPSAVCDPRWSIGTPSPETPAETFLERLREEFRSLFDKTWAVRIAWSCQHTG